MSHLVLPIQILNTFALFGLIWLVQVVQYPAFVHVPKDGFLAYHHAHTRNISRVVIPLMFLELATVCWLVIDPVSRDMQTLSLFGLTIVIWLSTFLLQVPCHNQLAQGKNDVVIHRLVVSNWVRTSAWSLKAMLIFAWYL